MADPDLDHGLVCADDGLIDFERSPFFDPEFGGDTTVEGYIKRVRFLVKETVEARLGINSWFQEVNPDATIHPSYAALQRGLTSRSTTITRVATATEDDPEYSLGDLTSISEADEIDKICSVIGSPCQSSWGDGLRLADKIKFRFPQYPGIHLSMLIPSASEYAISLISSLCSWDPHRRPTAAKALQHPFFQPCYYIPPSLRLRDTGIYKTPPTAGMKGPMDHHSARRFSLGPVPNYKPGNNFCSTTYNPLRTGGAQRKLDMYQYQDSGPGERFAQNSPVQPLYRPPARRNNAGQNGITHGFRALERLVHPPTNSSDRVAGMEELLAGLNLNSGSPLPKQTLPSFKAGNWHSHAEYLNGSCGRLLAKEISP